MIPLFKPYMPEELDKISEILHSGQLAYGRWGKHFENLISDYIGSPYVLCTNSYNSAMLLAITTLDIGHNDEVIASPMSCLASNQPIVSQGAKVKWADIDPERGTLDPDKVRKKITSKTKAIFHNHHCGYPGFIDEINKISIEHGLVVLDDALEAFGSMYKGRLIGSVGSDVTVFSFETVRLPNCVMGGAVVFKNQSDYLKAKRVRDYGVNRERFRDELGEISPNCDVDLPGFGIKPPEINSYIGSVQMKMLPNFISMQSENADYWNRRIEASDMNARPLNVSNVTPNYWVYGTLALNKKRFIVEMRKQGFYASGVHLNNNRYSIFGDQTDLMGVNDFYSKFVALPSGWWMNSKIGV